MKRLPRGITKRRSGAWRISVRVKGRLYQKTLKKHVALDVVLDELAKRRKTWRAGRRDAKSGTLADDVARYLKDYFTGRPGYEERQRHLTLWVAALGSDTARERITRDDVSRILNGWRGAGLAAETCNKRRTALLSLYHALDGRGGSNPVREVPKFRAPDPLPRGLAYDRIEQALENLPVCKTRARLAVMAYTGIRAGQLMKMTPDHWDHRQHVLTVPGTGKGRGTKPYVVPLTRLATNALEVFDGLNAWGRFTWAPMARMWKAAAVKAGLPASVVPYDLRHSFGTRMYRATGGDLKATKEMLGHSSMRMTERYMLAAVPEHKMQAVRAFSVFVDR